jgi:uncharacterized protein YllA (UPF0747 family)
MTNTTKDKVLVYRSAWSRLASDVAFGELTLDEFVQQTKPLLDLHDEIEDLQRKLASKKTEWAIVEEQNRLLLRRVSRGVEVKPGYGLNSQLYGDLGFVRLADRKSGMVRKTKNTNPSTDAA